MILLKSCPRCGGDVDATYQDEAYCVQCGNRPHVEYPGPRVTNSPGIALEANKRARKEPVCPKCYSDRVSKLQKIRHDYNTCYRCHECGHIYSPVIHGSQKQRNA